MEKENQINNNNIMKKVFFFLVIIYCSNCVFSQGKLPVDTLKYLIEESFFNGKPYRLKSYCDSTGKNNCFTILQQDKKIRELLSKTNTQNYKFYFYTNNKLMFFVEFQNNKVNGNLIWFSKRGKLELIARYKESKWIGIIYFRKRKNLEKFYKLFGTNAPVGIVKETKIY